VALRPPNPTSAFLFRGPIVLTGALFVAIGYLAELLVGPEYAFEYFMLFGGLFLGIGYERNRQESLRRSDA
jgi:hypothetical protein